MNRTITALTLAGGLMCIKAASADTALMHMTPKNLRESKFRVSHKATGNQVEFNIRRDVRNIDGPGRSAYLSNAKKGGAGLGTPVKLKEEGSQFTFRFSVPADQVADTVFTLWGYGARGEGITFEFNLSDFWKPEKP